MTTRKKRRICNVSKPEPKPIGRFGKLPPMKLYSLKIPIAHLAAANYYAAKECRVPADFYRHAIRTYIEQCEAKHGAIPDEINNDLINRINDGGRITGV